MSTRTLKQDVYIVTLGTFYKGTEVKILKTDKGLSNVLIGTASFFIDCNKLN